MSGSLAKTMIAAEFHCHTVYSHDGSIELQEMIAAARALGIQRLAVTDHDSIKGALAAYALAPELIVVGEEVRTRRGELIGYYMKEEIPPGLSVQETLSRFKDQGAFISIPHPFDRLRSNWDMDELLEMLPELDAMEVFNARCLRRAYNSRALAFAQAHHIPMLAGSDAHHLEEVGITRTLLPLFNSAEELREAVRETRFEEKMISAVDHMKHNLHARRLKRIGRR